MAASSSPPPSTTTTYSLPLVFFFSSFILLHPPTHAQQNYTGSAIYNCFGNSTRGYYCNGFQPTCTSFLLFRSQTNYQSPVEIAYLLNASAPDISRLNSALDIAPLSLGTPVLVPVTCTCSHTPSGGPHYQHDTYYTLKSSIETWLMIATETYQGLSTCKAMRVQNPDHDALNAGIRLKVPLRCACPTTGQIAAGYKYLLSYVVASGDMVSFIALRFRTNEQAVLDANQIGMGASIHPFTTLLVPLKEEPTKALLASPPPHPRPDPSPTEPRSSTMNRVVVGIGVAVAALLAFFLLLVFWLLRRRRCHPPDGSKACKDPSTEQSTLSHEARALVGSLAVYKFEELQKSTGFFGEAHQIEGSSVYRGIINGNTVAVKRMKGDVFNEINVLKQMNHLNLIRLWGFCVHEVNTYLVFEFAERGSLRKWLHQRPSKSVDYLTWKQRVQIAYDVAEGVNYLHNYTTPQCIHKDLNSSNILLDRGFRAKVSNFGLARSVAEEGEAPLMTEHLRGTQGYMSPEYLEHGLISPMIDVFAFGVVMLELLSGNEAVILPKGSGAGITLLSAAIGRVLEGQVGREKMRQFIDPCLGGDYPLDSAFAMAQLAKQCVAQEPSSRPTIAEVFASLSAIHTATLDWDSSWANVSQESVVGR